MNGESKVFTEMKFFMGKFRLFLALAFAITIYHFYDSDILHPAGLSRVITVHGEQEENGIEANGQAESTGTPTGDATGDYAAHVKVNPVPRTYVRGFRACPSGTSEHSPRSNRAG